jgi:hypothetical protein
MRLWLLLLTLPALAGCLHDGRPSRERGGPFETAPEVKAPAQGRCEKLGKTAVRQRCDEARYLAELYARKLSTGDDVCLEGGVGDSPGGACLTRAQVSDVGTGKVLLEIREARPDSRWFHHVQNQVWFDEGALVDLYLAERGY